MSDLIDIAYTAKELKARKNEYVTGDSPQYPWGTCLRLEKPELTKLGMTDLPGIGDEFHIMIVAKVTSVNQQLRENDDDSMSVALQITMMEIVSAEDDSDENGEKETPAEEGKETPKSLMSYYKGEAKGK